MKMNRRNALIGLGAIATGGGALFGSGAFSQVDAQRGVSISATGDGSALLVLDQGSGATGIVDDTSAEGDTITNIEFSASNLNGDAKTVWNDALQIQNGGQDQIDLYIADNKNAGQLGQGEALDFEDESDSTIVGSSNAVRINSGNAETVYVDIVVDLQGTTDRSQIPSSVTFTATTV